MEQNQNRYFIVHKPYNMVSQFKSPDVVRLLGALNFQFPEGIHAIGRLDNLSEGLLILTTNKKVTKLLFESSMPHKRTYFVRINGIPKEEELSRLRNGIPILIKGNVFYKTKPCEVKLLENPVGIFPLPEANKEWTPHSWISISLTEGKFHQVRKMTLAIGHKCKRLIRTSIEDLTLADLPSGGVREIEEEQFFKKLKINNWQ